MDFGLFYIDLALIQRTLVIFFSQPTYLVILDLIAIIGWVVFSYLLFYIGVTMWVEYRQSKFTKNWKWVLLAVDIPPLNVQPPIAVEQMFSQLTAAFNQVDITEKFWQGFKQQWFSFEIISIGGYIQFLIRTEQDFRDLVEAAIYAQYPDAEIIEVEDYVNEIPSKYPDETYDIWAADFAPIETWAYPIRTYQEFEARIGKDTIIKDPMGTFLESFSRIGPGEQMWFQILIEPISNSWKKQVIEKIEEITGVKSSGGGKNIGDYFVDFSLKSLETIGDQVFNRPESESKEEKKDDKKQLSPGQGKLIEGMEEKIKKDGFRVKMRGIYAARKEVFRKERGVTALAGAIAQFNIPSANSLAPVYKTAATSFFAAKRILYRKNLLIQAYKKRKLKTGANPFVLNIVELATLWHFPLSHVKTPLVQKAAAKAAEPPASLPMEQIFSELPVEETKVQTEKNNVQEDKYATDAGYLHEDSGPRFG